LTLNNENASATLLIVFMKKNKIKLSILSAIIIIVIYVLLNLMMGNQKFKQIFSIFTPEQKYQIKKYIFPYKFISEIEKSLILKTEKISNRERKILQKKKMFQTFLYDLELKKKEGNTDIPITKSNVKLSNGKILEKYKLEEGFYYGINKHPPLALGSGYIDFFEDNIFVLSGRGILAYRKNLNGDEVHFKQIKNNLNDFISRDQFKKHEWFSFKDIHIFKNQILISYSEEIKEDCWNTSILIGNINYENIQFKKFFSRKGKECISTVTNIDKEFNGHQSGGRIITFDDNHILYSLGEYRSRHLAQNKDSVNGKIIKININTSEYQIISMGHRNPQGLLFDKENNFLLNSEHGPMDGCEINLIDLEKINKDNIPNYGWPIASYGEHYGGKVAKNKNKYKKYPLYKSHSKHGFIEPLKAFVPSHGVSEMVKIGKNKYVLSSMGMRDKKGNDRPGDKSLYFFELNDEKKLINLEQLKVFERIRDLKIKDNKLYLFMENTASIGVISLN
jgi:hypothetical protein